MHPRPRPPPKQQVQQLATPELAGGYTKRKFAELEELQRGLLGFDAILKAEGLAATEAEIEAELGSAVAEFTQYGQEYDAARLREQVEQTLEVRGGRAQLLRSLGLGLRLLARGSSPGCRLLALLCYAGPALPRAGGSAGEGQPVVPLDASRAPLPPPPPLPPRRPRR